MDSKTRNTNLICCSVYDSAVGVYFQPFFARSRLDAVRSFGDAVTQDGHVFSKHPEDFTLFSLAEWSEDSGEFIPSITPEKLCTALELAQQAPDPRQVQG